MACMCRINKEVTSVRTFFQSRAHSGTDVSLQESFADSLLMMLKGMKEFGPSEGGAAQPCT